MKPLQQPFEFNSILSQLNCGYLGVKDEFFLSTVLFTWSRNSQNQSLDWLLALTLADYFRPRNHEENDEVVWRHAS